jgi:threonine dehydratase
VGGGGLLMGLTEYLKHHASPVYLYGCEAYNSPTYAEFQHVRSRTIADGLILDFPHASVQTRIGEMNVALHLVHEREIQSAMADLYDSQGLVVEPSSAVTTAFVKTHLQELEVPICMVFTGGNISREYFDELIQMPGRQDTTGALE